MSPLRAIRMPSAQECAAGVTITSPCGPSSPSRTIRTSATSRPRVYEHVSALDADADRIALENQELIRLDSQYVIAHPALPKVPVLGPLHLVPLERLLLVVGVVGALDVLRR